MEVKYLQPQTGEHIFFFCPAGRLIPVEQFLVDWEKHCDELKSVDVVKEYDELEDVHRGQSHEESSTRRSRQQEFIAT